MINRLLLWIIAGIFMTGCMGQHNIYKVVVQDLSIPYQEKPQKKQADSPSVQTAQPSPIHDSAIKTRRDLYIVQKGDTLYSISEQFGINYRDIAELNKLSNDAIQPGQNLWLPLKPGQKVSSAVQSSSTQVQPSEKKSGAATQPASSDLLSTGSSDASGTWVWPTAGKITSAYQHNQNKGIDIGGKLDQPVLAAASGKVIYTGSDLIGYGKLIIINHGKQIMSAYAHNNKILVMEGDQVTQGQPIAQMGKTEAGVVQLHFEIREDGNPVDPLAYLPPK